MAAPKGNKYAIGNSGGRPPMYNSPEEIAPVIDEYFEYIKGEKKEGEEEWERTPEPATITGLALYLGFDGRQSLYDYRDKQEFSVIIKKAISRVEHNYEKALSYQSPTGAIFALKNMGWKDKVEQEVKVPDGIVFKYVRQQGNEPISNGDRTGNTDD
jgi:hypothetical protein